MACSGGGGGGGGSASSWLSSSVERQRRFPRLPGARRLLGWPVRPLSRSTVLYFRSGTPFWPSKLFSDCERQALRPGFLVAAFSSVKRHFLGVARGLGCALSALSGELVGRLALGVEWARCILARAGARHGWAGIYWAFTICSSEEGECGTW